MMLLLSLFSATGVTASAAAATVSDANSFLKEIAKGGEIQLTADISLNQKVTINEACIIDFNGKTITFGGGRKDKFNLTVNAPTTLKNGTLTSSCTNDPRHSLLLVHADTTVENMTISQPGNEGGSWIVEVKKSAKFTMIDSTITYLGEGRGVRETRGINVEKGILLFYGNNTINGTDRSFIRDSYFHSGTLRTDQRLITFSAKVYFCGGAVENFGGGKVFSSFTKDNVNVPEDYAIYSDKECTTPMTAEDVVEAAAVYSKLNYTLPTGLEAEVGAKLSEIQLPDGFTFNNPDEKVNNIGDNSFAAVYAPDAADTTKRADVTITVKGIGIHHEAVAPTCEDNGTVEYWEDGLGNTFADQDGLTPLNTVVDKATNHSFIHFLKWVWDGFNKAVAWLFCDNNPEHIETRDIPSTVDTEDLPTCTEDGYTYYVATIDVAGKLYTSVNIDTVDQIGHNYGEAEYVWADDNSTVTATRTCKNDASHVETETVKTTYEVVKEAAVGEEGTGRYTAAFTNKAFDTQTEDVEIPALPETTTDSTTDSTTDTSTDSSTDTSTDTSTDEPESPDTPDTPDTPDKPIKRLLGDVNNDGRVTAKDALLVQRYVVKLAKLDEIELLVANVDAKGKVTNADALLILRYAIKAKVSYPIGEEFIAGYEK